MIKAKYLLLRGLKHPVGQNALALYGVQAARYILPLITIPYLARILGPSGFGLVVFSQSFAVWLTLILDYGFNLSATRDIARNQGNREQICTTVTGVLSAKLLLLVITGIVALISGLTVPMFRENIEYLFWAWVFAVGLGLSPLWYFQGVERMRLTALLDLAARVVATGGIFLLVNSASEGWKVLAFQASASLLVSGIALWWMYKETRWCMPRPQIALSVLRSGWNMFLYRGTVSLYTTANIFILGLFVSPALVGLYGGAEKISRAMISLTQPISQSLFPTMNHLIIHSPSRAGRLVRLNIVLMSAFGVGTAIILFVYAPFVVRILLGSGFEQSVPILRILSLMIPSVAIAGVLGMQWMLPLGLDREFNTIAIFAGLFSLIAAFNVAPRLGIAGIAWTLVISETLVTVSMFGVLKWQRLDPTNYLKSLDPQTKIPLETANKTS